MTFGEARTAHLKQFDESCAKLRDIVADPKWCNHMFPDYKAAIDAVSESCASLSRLNGAQLSAERVASRD